MENKISPLILLIFISLQVFLYGQSTNGIIQLDCGDTGTLPAAVINQPYSTRFASNTSGNWSVSGASATLGLSINTDGVLSASRILNAPPDEYTIIISKGSTLSRTFTLPIGLTCEPCETEVAFVMDQSSSMAATVDGISRWEALKAAMNIGYPSLSAYFGHKGRWVMFRCEDDTVVEVDRGDFLEEIDDPSDSDFDPLSSFLPNGLASVGGGIQKAVMDFFSEPQVWKKRIIEVITDGRQNTNPLMHTNRTIRNSPGISPPDGVEGPNGLPINLVGSDIVVHAVGIGVGSTGAEYDLLERFSTDGFFYAIPDNSISAVTLANNLDGSIGAALQGCSPRFIETTLDTISNSFKSKTFKLNDSIDFLTIQFVAKDRFFDPQIRLYKNDTLLRIRPLINTRYHVLFKVDFKDINSTLMSSKGSWKIEYRDNTTRGSIMQLTVIAEDKFIRHSLDFLKKGKTYAGDDLPVQVKLSKSFSGLDNAIVKAFLLKPGDDLGNLAAKALYDPIGANNDITRGQAKVDYVAIQPEYIKKLGPVKVPEITLKPKGNGEYEGVFSGNKVTGAYQIFYTIEGGHPILGAFQGKGMRFKHVDFSRPEDLQLNKKVAYGRKVTGIYGGTYNKDEKTYFLKIKPVNKFGNYLGPAQESRIAVRSLNSNNTVGRIRDNLDGSYTIPIMSKDVANPKVSIYVIDMEKPVSKERLFPLGFSIGIEGGATFPIDSLKNIYKSNPFGAVRLSYRFSPQFSSEIMGGAYSFRDSFNITAATLWGKYTFSNANSLGMDLNLGVGGGYFVPKGSSNSLGYGVKVGLSKDLNETWTLGFDLTYFKVLDNNLTFGLGGISVQFRP